MISVIIPTYHEESHIKTTIKALRSKDEHYLIKEIIVADGGSQDNTVVNAQSEGAKAIICPQKGRAAQMNYGASLASESILYFLHADTIPPQNFTLDLVNLVNKGFAAGCYRLTFDYSHWFLKANCWFTRFDVNAFRFGDQSLFVTKEKLLAVGGFCEKHLVLEDQHLIKKLKRVCSFKVIQKPVVTSARKYLENGIYRTQAIFFLIYFMYGLGLPQSRLISTYRKLIRQNKLYFAMKPNDNNAKLPPAQRPFRILIISGSDRRQYNCPGVDSKSRTLMLQMAEMLPADWEIDYEDLGNVYGRARIQSCNACASTSMALCVWPCNCYEKNSWVEKDLMWEMDLYARLDMADAWAIIGPINWYAPTSNLKLMFDRLVCMNGGNPDETLIDHKDPEKAMALEHSPEWEELSVNHLEGRTAAFFLYGDEGANEMDETGRPKMLRHKHYFNPETEPFANERDAYAPLVWQCRYGGVEVPDQLWVHCTSGKGRKYSDNQAENMIQENQFMETFGTWVENFEDFVREKGKVKPGKWRAYGYSPATNLWKEAKTGIRSWMLRLGITPDNSSPEKQKELRLNHDITLRPAKSEGEKLRG